MPSTTAARKATRTTKTAARGAAPAAKPVSPPAGKAPKAPSKAAPAPVPAKPTAAAPAAPAPAKPVKVKAKLVRDGFTMPQADFDLIDALKARALKFQRPAKKSELLRAGLHVLTALDDALLRQALDALVPLKTGRPRKAD